MLKQQIHLKAPVSRVWKALTTASEFGQWFGVTLSDEFAQGVRVHTNTPGDLFCVVDQIQPERRFVIRRTSASKDAMTTVAFQLEGRDGGTLLTIIETGFESLAPAVREQAQKTNEQSWQQHTGDLERFVTT